MSALLRAGLVALLTALAVISAVSAQSSEVRLKETMTAAEFERFGLTKLTPAELNGLEGWLASHRFTQAAAKIRAGVSAMTAAPARSGAMVAYNTSNGKYHCLSCQWAARCTKNCITIPLAEAQARGVPCKVCGGSCQ